MSYEGRVQLWCEKGHYEIVVEPYAEELPDKCACGAPIVFTNRVDDTNCDAYGFITPTLVTPAEMCTCQCGNVHAKTQPTYKIPQKK